MINVSTLLLFDVEMCWTMAVAYQRNGSRRRRRREWFSERIGVINKYLERR